MDNAGAWKWVHPPEVEVGGVSQVHLGDVERSDSYIGPLVSSVTEPRTSSYPGGIDGNAPLPQATWHAVGGRANARGLIQRPRNNSAGAMSSISGAVAPGIIDSSGRLSSQSRHRNKRRGTSSRRKSSFTGNAAIGDESMSGSGMMASEKEDLERPVLPSFASSTGGWTGGYSPSHGHGSGHNGGGIPYSSRHRATSGASSLAQTPSRRVSRTITPSQITRVFVGENSSAARVGPPHRSASDIGSNTTTATIVTASTPLDSGSGLVEPLPSASRNAE